MVLDAVSSGVTERLRLCSLLLSHISIVERSSAAFSDDLARMQKGVFFVQLYAALEYTVTNSFSTFLELISRRPLAPRNYEPALLSVLLNSNFKSLLDSGKKNSWKKKFELLNKVFSDEVCNVDSSVFPSSAMNIAHQEIKDIWFFLGLSCPTLPDGVHPPLLMEIKDHRNAIAHGRECANTIGGRYSIEQLKKKYTDVELLCHHVVNSIDKHYRDKFHS
ncbi:MAE_28990/MAE_18760 family HEPN-like nuclease [Serratia marcescens]|uniref:MAE_28990/MAE_18760 family HEPN-like nuclease n=1 Tax=Serratia marcescens TaxID=615 RepID=UPI0011167A48|nr:MAE_28990/MAE_18760 family HEPN-like nuclease [Serratia marcescens]CAI1547208.1 Uncharacterised protein [Serratia marcescens]